MNNRAFLFGGMPTDVHQLIFRDLSKDDLIAVRRSCFGGKTQVDTYLSRVTKSNKHLLGFLSCLSREDIALFLRRFYSDKSIRLKALKKAVSAQNPCHFAYAVHALVADVTTLDRDRLQDCITLLRTDNCPARIIATLDIIHFYLTHEQTAGGKELSQEIYEAGDAYINLRGATIINSFYAVDLSFADFRETKLYASLAVLSMAGADVSHARFDAGTVLISVDTDGMVTKGLILADGFEPYFQWHNARQLQNPQLLSAVAARKKAQERADRPCIIL